MLAPRRHAIGHAGYLIAGFGCFRDAAMMWLAADATDCLYAYASFCCLAMPTAVGSLVIMMRRHDTSSRQQDWREREMRSLARDHRYILARR